MLSKMSRTNVKRPLIEQIEELKVKIALLEGDRRAYYESSFFAMQQNRETVTQLRKECYDLRRQLRDRTHADDHVISQAFQNRPVEKAAFSHKTTAVAIEQMDYKVSDTMKRYNLVKSITENKRQTLEDLQMQLQDQQANATETLAHRANESKATQVIRDMENRLDKIKLKCNEADYIRRTYEQIYNRLSDEHHRCNNVLDDMEADIRRCSQERNELIVMSKDAITNKDSTLEELRRHEEYIYADKKRREIELTRMRKVAEDKKLENERVEKKTVDDVMEEDAGNDSFSYESTRNTTDDERLHLSQYEDRFKILKDVTGIPDLNGILNKFESQLEVKQKLINVINEMEGKINKLRQERATLQTRLDEMKSTGEAKNLEAMQVVDEKKSEVTEKYSSADTAASEYDNISKFIVQAKAGLEHMMEKLMHFRTKDRTNQSQINSAEEYIMDLFRRIESTFERVLEDLSSFDLDEYKEKLLLEEDILVIPSTEFQSSVKKKLPTNNFRVKAPSNRERAADEDEESGEDLPEWRSRVQMKKAAEEFIMLKTKKKNQRRKKKCKNL